MELIAKQDFTYADRPLKVGERFIAVSAEDARLLKGFGKADDAPQRGGYATRQAEASDQKSDQPEGEGGSSRKRRYNRRDMQATES